MSEPQFEQDGGVRIDLVGVVRRHRRALLMIPALVTLIVGVLAGAYLVWLQPVHLTSVLEFRPQLVGLRMSYPNGTSFALSDITNRSILDAVYDANELEDYCSRDEFANGFYVEERSTRRELLDADYGGRIEAELVADQRQRLRVEWEDRLAALPRTFRLVFVRSTACAGLPGAVLSKTMTEILTQWGRDSDIRRGVLALTIPRLTPEMVAASDDDSLHPVLRLDGLRNVTLQVGAVVEAVLARPASAAVRVEGTPSTFVELRLALERLQRARVEPLMMQAAAGAPREVAAWAQAMADSSARELEGLRGREAAYQLTLREFSGENAGTRVGGRTGSGVIGESAQFPAVTPQLDQTFVDRLIQMSVFNHPLREGLAEQLKEAALATQSELERSRFYESLARAARTPGSQTSAASVAAGLQSNMAGATALIAQLSVLLADYDTFVYRPEAELFAFESPVMSRVERGFSPRDLWTLLVTIFFFAFLIVAIRALASDYIEARQRA